MTTQIEAGKVFVNGKLITNNGYRLKEGDLSLSGKWDELHMMEFYQKQKRDAT